MIGWRTSLKVCLSKVFLHVLCVLLVKSLPNFNIPQSHNNKKTVRRSKDLHLICTYESYVWIAFTFCLIREIQDTIAASYAVSPDLSPEYSLTNCPLRTTPHALNLLFSPKLSHAIASNPFAMAGRTSVSTCTGSTICHQNLKPKKPIHRQHYRQRSLYGKNLTDIY